MVFLTIEDTEALAALDAIAATPGVDGLVIGRADLAQALGIPGQFGHADIVAAEEKIRAAARANGLVFYGEEIIDAGIDQDLLLHGWIKARQQG
jgi:2-keto-3-deoxy-L-rhamnonate aldolase RhmA